MQHTHTHTRLTALCPGLPGWAGTTRKVSGFYWSMSQWVAVASAGPYASLHFAPDRWPRQHLTTQFFTERMPFLPPNQQRQSTEATIQQFALKISRVKSAMVSAIVAPQYPLCCQYVTSHHTTLNWDTWSKPTIITGQPPLASKPVKTWILGFVPAKFYYMPLLMATSAFGLRYDTIRDAILTCAREPT